MIKTCLALGLAFICSGLSAGTVENASVSSDLSDKTFQEALKPVQVQEIFFQADEKHNQQNLALAKIKVNNAQPDMENTAVLTLKDADVDFALKDLSKDGFKVKAYTSETGSYIVLVDLTGKNAASESLGLAKYYYVKEVFVGQNTYNQLFQIRSSYAVKMGTVRGLMNYSKADLTIDKVNWLIRGNFNLGFVWIEIDNDKKIIKGSANKSDVNLGFTWSEKEVSVKGAANNSPVDYIVNWKEGVLKGYSNNAPLEINFDMKEGQAGENIVELKGYAKNYPVTLTFDKISGELKGSMNNAPVEVKLQNCDLYDFLQYVFLFLGND